MLKHGRLKAALAIVLSAAVFAALVFLIVLAFFFLRMAMRISRISKTLGFS